MDRTDLELDDGVGGDVVSGRLQALHTHTSSVTATIVYTKHTSDAAPPSLFFQLLKILFYAIN